MLECLVSRLSLIATTEKAVKTLHLTSPELMPLPHMPHCKVWTLLEAKLESKLGAQD